MDIRDALKEEINSQLPPHVIKIHYVNIYDDIIEVIYVGRVSSRSIKANAHDPNCLHNITRLIEDSDTEDMKSYGGVLACEDRHLSAEQVNRLLEQHVAHLNQELSRYNIRLN